MTRKCLLCGMGFEHTTHNKGLPAYVGRRQTEKTFAAKMPVKQTFNQMRPTGMRIQTYETSKTAVSFVDIKAYWKDGRAIPFYYDVSSPPVASVPTVSDVEEALDACDEDGCAYDEDGDAMDIDSDAD